MPIFLSKTVFTDSKLGVWQIKEPDDYFSSELQLTDEEHEFVDEMKGRRKGEWLSSRHLIHIMSERDERAEILKDEFGKPYIHDSDHHISFSHSHGMSAAIASRKLVGIDIQFIVSKISRIAPKFMNDEEWIRMEKLPEEHHIDIMHIFWGGKESLFKAYGKKSVDFKKHMDLELNAWNGEIGAFEGTFNKEDFHCRFLLEAQKIDKYILVYAKQI